MNNYKNRKLRGQCSSCTNPAMYEAVRCQSCQSKHKAKQQANSEAANAQRRDQYFRRSMDRERRLEEIDAQLKREIAELERVLAR